jgi:hypothetical protein
MGKEGLEPSRYKSIHFECIVSTIPPFTLVLVYQKKYFIRVFTTINRISTNKLETKIIQYHNLAKIYLCQIK